MDKPMPGGIFYTNNPPVEIKGDMTLRDYFAAKAMQGVIAGTIDKKSIANWSYEMADAMLEQRLKENT